MKRALLTIFCHNGDEKIIFSNSEQDRTQTDTGKMPMPPCLLNINEAMQGKKNCYLSHPRKQCSLDDTMY